MLTLILDRSHHGSPHPHNAGFALVKFENAEVAGMAIAGLNGYQVCVHAMPAHKHAPSYWWSLGTLSFAVKRRK